MKKIVISATTRIERVTEMSKQVLACGQFLVAETVPRQSLLSTTDMKELRRPREPGSSVTPQRRHVDPLKCKVENEIG